MRIINTVLFAAVIAVNALANTVTIGGNKTGDVSGKYPNLFTPAGITFAIWGIIYILLGIFVVCQFTLSSERSNVMQESVKFWFLISCIGNIAWIFLWHYEKIELSTIAMLVLLFSLIMINVNTGNIEPASIWEKLSIIGFNVYLGWISAATIANVSVMLVKIKWNGFGISEQLWTVLVILVGMAIGICFTLAGNRPFASLAIIWAYLGIVLKHFQANGYNKTYPLIIATTIFSIVLMAMIIVCVSTRKEA